MCGRLQGWVVGLAVIGFRLQSEVRVVEGKIAVASVFSHAVAALGIGACFYRPGSPKRVWVIGALCSIVPDLDVIGFRFGIHYGDFWGHRGFTHSLVFAALLASAVAFLGFRQGEPGLGRFPLWMYFFLATASHGLLDAMTDGGLGVAFFSPFNNTRYFLPWTPIRVSPIGVNRFFSPRGLEVVRSELLWIWLPAALLLASAWLIRRRAMAST
jgi:inner membrane protein